MEFVSWQLVAGDANIADVDAVTTILTVSSTDAYVSAVYRDTGTVSNHIHSIEKSVRIFPNPSSGQFQIEIPDYSSQSKFEIFNTMGRLVQTGYLESNVASIDMKNTSKGTYVLRLTTEAMVYTELLIIK